MTLAHQLARIGVVPHRIRVRDPLLAELLGTLVQELAFEIEVAPNLPALDPAKEALTERFT